MNTPEKPKGQRGPLKIKVICSSTPLLCLELFLKKEAASFPSHIKRSLKLFIVFMARRHHSVPPPQAQPCVTILKNVKK